MTRMKLKISIGLVVMMLACLVSGADGQKSAPIMDRIARSLPQIESGWKHKSTNVYEHDDGSAQANIKWSSGDIERGATVIVTPDGEEGTTSVPPQQQGRLAGRVSN